MTQKLSQVRTLVDKICISDDESTVRIEDEERRRHHSLSQARKPLFQEQVTPKPGSTLAEFLLSYFEYNEDLIIQKKTQNADRKLCKKTLIFDPEQPSFVSCLSRHLKSSLFFSFL